MDGQQDNAFQPFGEAWFDVANPCGKEFELPSVCSPINPRWSDNNNLVFLQDQQPHTSDLLDNSYELEMISPSCAGNQVDSSPIMEMVPSLINCVPTVDQQEGSSTGNHKVQFPQLTGLLKSEFEGAFPERNQHVHVPTSASYSWKGLDIKFSMRNQEFLVGNSSNSPSISSTDLLCLKNNPTNAPRFSNSSPNACQLDSDGCIINNHVCFSSSGCSSSFGSGGYLPVRSLEIRSYNLADSPSFIPNGSSVWRNQVAYAPVMTNTSGTGANGDINHGPNPLLNAIHNTRIRSNVSVPVENHVGPSTYARSNCHSSEKNQAFGSSSMTNGRCNVKYICKLCNSQFPNYNSYGEHMSFHEKTEMVWRNLASQTHTSHINSLGSSNLSREITDKKIEENNSQNKAKERLEKSFREKRSPSDEILKNGCYQSHKRFREVKSPPKDIVENKNSLLCKVQKTELSSPRTEQNGDQPTFDACQQNSSK